MRPYTQKENRFILEHWDTQSAPWIGQQLQRTGDSVNRHAKHILKLKGHKELLALKKQQQPQPAKLDHVLLKEPSFITPPTKARLMAGR